MSIEDPFDQDDWDSYAVMTADMGSSVQVRLPCGGALPSLLTTLL